MVGQEGRGGPRTWSVGGGDGWAGGSGVSEGVNDGGTGRWRRAGKGDCRAAKGCQSEGDRFLALDISGKNYLSWILDAEVHLSAASFRNTIIEGNKESLEDRSKALIFLRRHLDESSKAQYLTVKYPYTLWTELKGRFDHKKSVILPRARYEWMHLRLQDFKSVDYAVKLCGETITESDLLEKTYSTFYASNMVLQQQYRERQFKTYSELISCLLVAEQNNELLMQNHQTHLTGVGKRYGRVLGPKQFINKKKSGTNSHPKKGKKDISKCRRCGTNGYWADICRAPKHLASSTRPQLKRNSPFASNFSVSNPS
ncbi:hypothetical protein RND81_12G149000 [Saponaria officinalis]|uniref:Uncharacterized protein n=1 Tax=Saponaria officinalis TaxID=3572 RepID=A0AAW1HAW1_SAPOF